MIGDGIPSGVTFGPEVQQDRVLVDRCIAGDAKAWEELYANYHDGLLATIKVWLGPKRWDPNVLDEIVARVWYAVVLDGGALLDRFDPDRECRLSTFLGSIAKGVAASFFRAERRRRRRERLASRPESHSGHDPLGVPPSEFEEFCGDLTPSERRFLADILSQPVNGKRLRHLSAANRWKLRSRISRKLHEFLFMDS